MGAISVAINTEEARRHLSSLGQNFKDGGKSVRIAVMRAINDTLKHMVTDISARVRQTYNVKKSDLDRYLKVRRAGSFRSMRGGLYFSRRHSMPLSMFGATQNKNYVSVKVLKSMGKGRIKPRGNAKSKHKQTIVTTPKGRAAVWMAKGQVMARVEEKERPVVLYGPSFMSFFTAEGIPEALNEEAQAWFDKRLTHHIARAIKGKK